MLPDMVYGFLKASLDAHTMGVLAASDLLRDCGYRVVIGDREISRALDAIQYEKNQEKIVQWILDNNITRVGVSYRLDPSTAVTMVGYLVAGLKRANLLTYQGGPISSVFFAGLKDACLRIGVEHGGLVKTFSGGESAVEFLTKMGVPEERISRQILDGSKYDDSRMEFGKGIVDSGAYQSLELIDRSGYAEFGTRKDTLEKRLAFNRRLLPHYPLIRAHYGPYKADVARADLVQQFILGVKELARSGYLDILSIGTSQLSQSSFGEDWNGRPNGGGVPINSPQEYVDVWSNSRPLLLRTYSATKNIPQLAAMYEETINICWHALSFWWFNQIDGRGPYDLYTNLQQHFQTLKYIAQTSKPFEGNVPHHFAFRGSDDVTYLVAAYLAAKAAKILGIRTYILQNMLNTPRSTWGIQDLAKSRALLLLVRSLQDDRFRVVFQPRAGLDYFKPDSYEAMIQLAAVTALMDDIEPDDDLSPDIIHVVSYSEATRLATPDIIDESIKITLESLKEYRRLRLLGKTEDVRQSEDVSLRMQDLLDKASVVIGGLEESIPNLYTPEGFYLAFVAGFLPTPYLWVDGAEYSRAKHWRTKMHNGGVVLVTENNEMAKPEMVVSYGCKHLNEAQYCLAQRRGD